MMRVTVWCFCTTAIAWGFRKIIYSQPSQLQSLPKTTIQKWYVWTVATHRVIPIAPINAHSHLRVSAIVASVLAAAKGSFFHWSPYNLTSQLVATKTKRHKKYVGRGGPKETKPCHQPKSKNTFKTKPGSRKNTFLQRVHTLRLECATVRLQWYASCSRQPWPLRRCW